MQSKNILKLHKKHTNVVDLHDSRPILGHEEEVVDLRSPVVSGKRETFENALHRKLRGEDVIRKQYAQRKRKIDLSKLVSKSVAILLLVSLNSFALSQVGNTFSVLNDIEESVDNTFESGVLDFEMTVSPFSNDAWTNLIPGTTTDQDIDVVPNIISNPFVYFASSTNLTGDDNFCNLVHVLATLDGEVMYDGLLKDMITGTTTNLMAWNFEFSTDTSFFNSMCHFDIDWNGWQTRHDYPNYHDGYSDTETTTHWLFADGLKINKVYFENPDKLNPYCYCRCSCESECNGGDPCDEENSTRIIENDNEITITTELNGISNAGGNEVAVGDSGDEGVIETGNESSIEETSTVENINHVEDKCIVEDHEWVELYNPNDEFADIDGWFVCDGQSCDELDAPEPIPPFGYAIIYAEDEVLQSWDVPDDFVKIKIADGAIGDGLDNENDGLTLLRPDFFTIDHVNWGEPESTWPYYDPIFWSPGVLPAELGNMIARVPAGHDTNQPEDWHILAKPEVELLYPGAVVLHPWFWDYMYLVTWNATNTNGPDEDLSVDLILIQDTNYNYHIDEEDEHIVLAENTPNDGNEKIWVPEGFLGMIWLKVVVTGPENPLAQSRSISGFMFSLWPPHKQEDEDMQETIHEAITYEMEMTGESDYAHMLPEPFVPEEKVVEEEAKEVTREERRDREERGETDSETETSASGEEDESALEPVEDVLEEEPSNNEESLKIVPLSLEVSSEESQEGVVPEEGAGDEGSEETTEEQGSEEEATEEITEEIAEEVAPKNTPEVESVPADLPADEPTLPLLEEETGFREEITELIEEAQTQEESGTPESEEEPAEEPAEEPVDAQPDEEAIIEEETPLNDESDE